MPWIATPKEQPGEAALEEEETTTPAEEDTHPSWLYFNVSHLG